MTTFSKINNIHRINSNIYVKINNQWRAANKYVKIDGQWKLVHKNSITSDDIIGFKIIYRLNKNKRLDSIPRLRYNKNIPIKFDISGSKEMNYESKGVIYQYGVEFDNYEEGIVCYQGRLYAVCKDGLLIDISSDGNDRSRIGILDINLTDRFMADISISYKMVFESNGFSINGWNSFFTNNEFTDDIDYTGYPYYELLPEDDGIQSGEERKAVEVVDQKILPVNTRDKIRYSPIATIGIARNTMTYGYNMLASHGNLNQTLNTIKMNNREMPFQIIINEDEEDD